MKVQKIFLFFIGLTLFACNAPKAVYDYDINKDFSIYTNYSLFPDLKTGLNQLDKNRLLSSLDAAMEAKGFSIAENPQIYVNVYTEEYQQENRNNVGIGVGSRGGNMGVGVSGGIPLGGSEDYLQVTFDFVDVQGDALIWQAVVETKFNPAASPEQRKAQFDKIVQKALEGYPPEK